MTKLVCPQCNSDVPPEYADLSTETAFCSRCQNFFNCGDWIESALITPESLQNPPEGVSYEESAEGFKIAISTHSFWWFLSFVCACLYLAFIGFFSWAAFRAPSGKGGIVFLILTPFYLIGVAWCCHVLMLLTGKIVIQINGNSGNVFKGVGKVGWSRHFDWSGVKKIRLSKYYRINGNVKQVTLEGDQNIQLGRGMREDRLSYVVIALRLNQRKRSLNV